jgi:hypothetical protein
MIADKLKTVTVEAFKLNSIVFPLAACGDNKYNSFFSYSSKSHFSKPQVSVDYVMVQKFL